MRLKKLTLILLSMLSAWTMVANEPDSVYMFSYSVPGKTGLTLAWSPDTVTGRWFSIGDGYSFLNSDFGAWGSGKRMYSPLLVYSPDEKMWHCYWESTSSGKTMSHAASSDLTAWGPQDYFYTTDPLKDKKGNFIVPTPTTISLDGKEISGRVCRVPFGTVKYLSDFVDHRRYRDNLYAQEAKDDATRFAGLDSLYITVRLDGDKQKAISRNLIGVFFEDINYGADGGLYAELLQNRDFEYYAGEGRRDPEWGPMKAWRTDDGATVTISTDDPIHENNSHYVVLTPGTLINEGWDGITLRKGERYDFSAFVRTPGGAKRTLVVSLRDKDGKTVAEKKLSVKASVWKKVRAELTPSENVSGGSIALTLEGGDAHLDMVSLFPRNTFKGHSNGLRADLAETLGALKPRFMRFPGGCVAHGNGIDNMYDWKGSIGPLETRKPLRNLWGYHQTRGLGYHEYFQFCEDIGCEPLPVVAAGVPCQNSSIPSKHSVDELTTFSQQCGIDMEDMPSYVQDILDLIEYANGDAKTTVWGRKRAEAGHPKPFGLKYLGVGNEDIITDIFEERFIMIFNAVKEKYPEITVIGTVGPFYEGTDYDEGWRFASENGVPMVDEHYYVKPGWMIHNQDYYDRYDRSKPHVYLGEYAAHVNRRRNNMEAALAEALYLTSVERNGDVVEMASYAPLLAKRGHTQWAPDLIFFDNDNVYPTVNYWVQKMYGNNPGTHAVAHTVDFNKSVNTDVYNRVAVSAVTDEESGDMIVRLVNMLPIEVVTTLETEGLNFGNTAQAIVLQGAPDDTRATPVESDITLDSPKQYTMPAYSFTTLRFKRNQN